MALLVVTVTWGLIRIAPGSFYSGEKSLPPAIEENIKKKYGLDKPWYQQYFIMLGNTVRGDFGDSLKYQGQSVNEIIARLVEEQRWPYLHPMLYALSKVPGRLHSAIRLRTRFRDL